jgi:biofilm PGA synthesis N-glycosyltransferase PgaC
MHEYVLVTAVHNGEETVERTIRSVIGQTVVPNAWVIVDDRSTDSTSSIVERYADTVPWISLVRLTDSTESSGHSFSGKVRALSTAIANLDMDSADFIGILDADIAVTPGHYVYLISEMDRDPTLGLTGSLLYEGLGERSRLHRISLLSVSGGVQFFRSECFKSLKGFRSFRFGGEDAAMEIEARSRGWKVRTIPELRAIHYGYVGRASGSPLRARLKRGRAFHQLGYHPLFQLVKLFANLTKPPAVIGSMAELIGFVHSWTSRSPVLLDPEVISYLRREQLRRLNPFRRLARKQMRV